MLFKGDELPPPRHAIDGDLEDDSNVDISYFLEIPENVKIGGSLMLLAPRLASLVPELGGVKTTVIRLQTKLICGGPAVTSDLYDQPSEEATTTVREWLLPVFLAQGKDMKIILAPPLPEAESAFVGKEIVKRLRPTLLWAASPCVSFDSRVSVVWTSSASYVGTIPLAVPPTIVQGVVAAALSRSEMLMVPAVGFLVASDGPSGHEVIASSDLSILKKEILGELGLKNNSESLLAGDLSTLYV